MPINVTNHAGAAAYQNPLIGPFTVLNLKIDVSTLTTNEVDAYGYLKPGVLFYSDGDQVAAGEPPYGVSFEPVKLSADDNTTLATDDDVIIAVATNCVVNRDIAEDNLGRAYSADELAACLLAGSGVKLTNT